jgi:hypothetical protein
VTARGIVNAIVDADGVRVARRAASPDPLAALAAAPGVADAVQEARSAVDRLLAHPVLRRGRAVVAAESALRSARASAALAGVDLPLSEVRAGTSDPVVQGALRVAAATAQLAPLLPRAPLQVVARLHALAGADLAPADDLGRPGPRVPAGARERLAALGGLLGGGGSPAALLLAAVAEGEVLTVRAFATANGIVARGLGRLVSVQWGLDPGAVCPVDVGHALDPESYRRAAEGYAAGDVVGWIAHYAAAVQAGAREGLAICESLVRSAGTIG